MTSTTARITAIAAVVATLTLIPLTLAPRASELAATPAEATSFVRIGTACAQATECSWRLFRICSTYDGNVKRYRCSAGCEDTIEEDDGTLT